MKTIEIECRTITEWKEHDEAIYEKIMEKYRDINVDNDHWSEFVLEMWADKLETFGYDVKEMKTNRKGHQYEAINISYSGFWSQGDGSSFTGEIDVDKWISINDIAGKYRRIQKLIQSGDIDIQQSKITRNGCHYVHERSTTVNIDWITRKDTPNIDGLMDKLVQAIEGDHISLNREIYRDLEKEYESEICEESVEATLEANEYEFDETGRIQ